MLTVVFAIVALLFALAAAVLAFIFILPERKYGKLNKFGKFLHDFCNFKKLCLEKILKFLYIFATAYSIVYGFLMVFSFETYTYKEYVAGNSWWETGKYVEHTDVEWTGYYGLLILIIAPVVIRIVYEAAIMLILILKNVKGVNEKLDRPLTVTIASDEAEPAVEEPAVVEPAKPAFCTFCGKTLNENGECDNPDCRH